MGQAGPSDDALIEEIERRERERLFNLQQQQSQEIVAANSNVNKTSQGVSTPSGPNTSTRKKASQGVGTNDAFDMTSQLLGV